MEVVATGLVFPEGPVALPNGDVLVVEVLGGRLSRVSPDGKVTTVAEVGGGPNGAAIGPDGRCYICNNGGMVHVDLGNGMSMAHEAPFDTPPGKIQVVDLDTGAFETLYDHCEETPFWGPNDIVFDTHGGFWFTDFGRDRGRIRQKGSVYYAKADGSMIREVIPGLDGANGIGLSPDGNTLYVAETYGSHVWGFKVKAPGEIEPGTSMHPGGGDLVGRAGPGQFLDSLAVDGSGRICVASPGGSAVLAFAPEGGAVEVVSFPDLMTTNICFGGPDLRTAYVTQSMSGRLVKVDWPVPGLKLAY